ncbi:hypothetical protein BOX15_Mlig010949g1 [Macrostomum lignano]|uniref:Uncharacterized protein n=1 Tax=Macrostomum lignano TaxID=282301 RepID=A0A267GV19_9PLAT|nr:hypothetical protein BOX15_Mlig010949g1 [Macrostomum lignano]
MSTPASKPNLPLRKIAPRVIAPRPTSRPAPPPPVKLPPVSAKPQQQQKPAAVPQPQQQPLQHQFQYSAPVAINGAGIHHQQQQQQQQQLLLSHHNSLPTCLAFSAAPGGGQILTALPTALSASQSLMAAPVSTGANSTAVFPPKRKLTGAAAASVARKQQQMLMQQQQQFIYQQTQQQQVLFSAMPVVSSNSFHGQTFYQTTLTHSRSEECYTTVTTSSGGGATGGAQDLLMLACQEAGLEFDFNLQQQTATMTAENANGSDQLSASEPSAASASPVLAPAPPLPDAAVATSAASSAVSAIPADVVNDDGEGHESFLRELGLLDLPDAAAVFECPNTALLDQSQQEQQQQQQMPDTASQQAEEAAESCILDDAFAACILDKVGQQQQPQQEQDVVEDPDTELLLEEAAAEAAAAIALSPTWPADVGDSCQSLLDEMMSCGPPPEHPTSSNVAETAVASSALASASNGAGQLADTGGQSSASTEPVGAESNEDAAAGLMLPTLAEPQPDTKSAPKQVESTAEVTIKPAELPADIGADRTNSATDEVSNIENKYPRDIVKTVKPTSTVDQDLELPLAVETNYKDASPSKSPPLSLDSKKATTPTGSSVHNGDNLFKRLRQDSTRSEESRVNSVQCSPVKEASPCKKSAVSQPDIFEFKKEEQRLPVVLASPNLKSESNGLSNGADASNAAKTVSLLTGTPCVVTDSVPSAVLDDTKPEEKLLVSKCKIESSISPLKSKSKRSKKHRQHHDSNVRQQNSKEQTEPAVVASDESPQKLPSLKITIKRPFAQQLQNDEDKEKEKLTIEQAPQPPAVPVAGEGGGLKLRLNLKSLGVNLQSPPPPQRPMPSEHLQPTSPSSLSSSASTSSPPPPRCYSNDSVDPHSSSTKKRRHNHSKQHRHRREKTSSSSGDTPPPPSAQSTTASRSDATAEASSVEPSVKIARLTLRLPLRQPAS